MNLMTNLHLYLSKVKWLTTIFRGLLKFLEGRILPGNLLMLLIMLEVHTNTRMSYGISPITITDVINNIGSTSIRVCYGLSPASILVKNNTVYFSFCLVGKSYMHERERLQAISVISEACILAPSVLSDGTVNQLY